MERWVVLPLLALLVPLAALLGAAERDALKRFAVPTADGRLEYARDERGNRAPDYSHAGYGGGAPIPDANVRFVVRAGKGDSTARVQAALDAVAALKTDANGLRGAVLLAKGRHEIAGSLHIRASGVVLRGEGPDTVLLASGTSRRAVVRVSGTDDRTFEKPRAITDKYVPVGANALALASAAGLKPGAAVRVEHPSTKAWIAALGMSAFPSRDAGSYLDWKPGTLDLCWERTVTKVTGDTIELDAALPSALDAALASCTVRSFAWPGRVRNAGVEYLSIESAFDRTNPRDEEHAWDGVLIERAEDVWVREVRFAHLAGSAVRAWETARRVTVSDCASADPVSELGGERRHTFFTAGHQTLFLRCTAKGGRHDFALGHLAAGPNAFVNCTATGAHRFSGPIGSWTTGSLFDGVTIDGAGLELTNRETDDAGAGWCSANGVLWNCTAPRVVCRAPPTARNWAVGVWGQFAGNGHWAQLNEFAKPDGLFAAQLRDRIGARAADVLKRRALPASAGAPEFEWQPPKPLAEPARKTIALTNGRLAVNEELLSGSRAGTAWWRGSVLPSRATEVGYGVTRFVPGRTGPGFTDDLGALADELKANGVAALEHHWGLWYDRRRDDHQMVRRIDGDAWAPFYEQPWARSGRGTAWDGLSKYDLTKFNPWYFARLKEFARNAERTGLLFVQHMYFQHNVLEAGAHWADFAWRPANCVQETGFPEPPEYVGGKRVFAAEAFYDVSHPVRRDLHRRYIRQCLSTLADSPNVLFHIGEEFTGPRHFVEFWLDTIAEWQRETGRAARVGLSCTKDVQDALLADAKRAALVSVIDIKYWWHTADGGTCDPKSGSLSPRQQLREWKGSKSRSDESVARAVREYATKFPTKAITASLDGASGWAVLAAGGSVPQLPAETSAAFKASVLRMKPLDVPLPKGALALAEPGRGYFVWAPQGGAIRLALPAGADLKAYRLDPLSGKATATGAARGGAFELEAPAGKPALVWLASE